MQRPSVAASLVLCLAALPAVAAAGDGLRGADCLDPSMARTWIEAGNNTILVDAGRRKYRMQITPGCAALGFSPQLGFKGDSVNGRVCGIFGDAIVTRGSACRIDRMELIDKAEYKKYLDDRKLARRQKPVTKSKSP